LKKKLLAEAINTAKARRYQVVLLGFNLDKRQMPTKTTLLLPLLNWTAERKYDERLVG